MHSDIRFKFRPVLIGILLFMCMGFHASAQTATCDTTHILNGKVEVSFTVNTNLSTLDSLEVRHFLIDSGDSTVSLFARYITEEDDVSSFRTWEVDETNSTITFSTGIFNSDEIHATVRIFHSTGIPEEYTFN